MKVMYLTIDALLCTVAFTPIAICRMVEDVQQEIRRGKYWAVLCIPSFILLVPLLLLCEYVSGEESSEDTEEKKAEQRRQAHYWMRNSIENWMEAADHHNSNFPDVMAALKQSQSSQSEMLSVLREMRKQQKRMGERQTGMEIRQMEMEKREMEMDARLKKIENNVGQQ